MEDERLRKLKTINLSPIYYSLMCVLVDQSATWEALVVHAYILDRAQTRVRPVFDDYLNALEECKQKGWLYEVTSDIEAQERERRETESIPACDDNSIPIFGNMDFTKEGYEIYKTARNVLWGSTVFGQTENPDLLRIDIYCNTLQGCISRRDEMLKCRDVPNRAIDDDDEHPRWYIRRVVSVSPPVEVGYWRLNRHEVLPSGFRISIQYCLEPSSEEAYGDLMGIEHVFSGKDEAEQWASSNAVGAIVGKNVTIDGVLYRVVYDLNGLASFVPIQSK